MERTYTDKALSKVFPSFLSMHISFTFQDVSQIILLCKVSTGCLPWDAIFPSSKFPAYFALIYHMEKTSFYLFRMGPQTEIHIVACVQIKGRELPWVSAHTCCSAWGLLFGLERRVTLGPFQFPIPNFVFWCSFSWSGPQIVLVSVPTKPD